MVQSLNDKKYQYFGSERAFYSGIQDIGSTTAWTFLSFSGTNTGFGTAGNEKSQRIAIVSSGTSYLEWSLISGTNAVAQAGEVWNGNSITQDGVNVSGLWIRTKAASQKSQIWAW